MKGRNVVTYLLLIFCFALSTHSQPRSGSNLPIPKGWRLPIQGDIKKEWSEAFWDQQCVVNKELEKRSAEDAIEERDYVPVKEEEEEQVDIAEGFALQNHYWRGNPGIFCLGEEYTWKPIFPIHFATGDYNGDGIKDEARILISATLKKVGIFVFLGTNIGKYKMTSITTTTDGDDVDLEWPSQYNYITTIKPSTVKIIADPTKTNSVKAITLKRDAIIFGFDVYNVEIGEAQSEYIAYWNSYENSFRVIRIFAAG